MCSATGSDEDARPPAFYLSSADIDPRLAPRRCYPVKRIRCGAQDDCLLIRIDPPLIGQRYGMGGRDIHQLIVAARLVGVSLLQIESWPVDVNIARPLVEHPERRDELRLDELETILWGELYPTEDEARGGETRFRP